MERDPFENEKERNIYGYRRNPDPRSRNLYVLFRRGWHEIPVVMFASILGIVGLGMVGYSLYVDKPENWNRKYKTKYTVYRDCDPRLKDIKYTN